MPDVMLPADYRNDRCGHNYLPKECPYEGCGYRAAVEQLEAARKALDGLYVSEYGKSGGELTLGQRIQRLAQDHQDYIHTINLNVAEAYRQPQLDLSMVRMRDAIVRLERRVQELLEANNTEIQRRRNFETEANQAHAEQLLLRNECIRLREVHSVLAGFIESLPETIEAPEEVAEAMEAVFPPSAEEAAHA